MASYDSAADDYILRTGSLSYYPGLAEELDGFAAALGAGPIADIGAGSGRDAFYLADSGRTVIAVDLSEQLLIRLAKRSFRTSVVPVRADLRRLPIASRSLAGLLCSSSLLHVPRSQTQVALGEFFRVLESGGVASISVKEGAGGEWYVNHGLGPRWMEYYSIEELVTLCRTTGFAIDRVYGPLRKGWLTAVIRRP